MSNDAIIERLKKVLALAKAGVGGEKDNAERQLNAMLRKHGMTMADLDGGQEKIVRCHFHYKNKFEYRLAMQIVATVLQRNKLEFRANHGSRSKMWHDMTVGQMIECEMTYNVMTKAMEDELDATYSAFIQVNHLYPPSSGSSKDPTPEELLQHLKASKMAQFMEKTTVNKAIEK